MKIAVAGGTGTAGRRVVEVARERGHDVVVIARSTGVDLVTGEGLAKALEGADAVIDASGAFTTSEKKALAFFEPASRNLVSAGTAAGVAHHVVLSIIGIDTAPRGLYAAKVAQEGIVEAGSVPHTIARVAQFHEFAGQVYDAVGFGPIHAAPVMRTQPVATREVGEWLVSIAEGAPQGRAPEFAGPREERLSDMVRAYARASGRGGWVATVPFPGELGRAYSSGALLPGPGAVLGRQTFAEWVAALPRT